MSLLSDTEIDAFASKGALITSNYDSRNLEPCSYDVRIGSDVFLTSAGRELKLSRGETFTILPGDYAIVTTLERFGLPNDVYARVGLKTAYSLRGLMNLSGPHITPGFRGLLVLGLANFGPTGITLRYGDPIFSVEFDRLSQPASHGYSGPMQDLNYIPTPVVDQLRAVSFEPIGNLKTKLEIATAKIETLQSVVYFVLLPVIIAAIAGLVAVIAIIH